MARQIGPKRSLHPVAKFLLSYLLILCLSLGMTLQMWFNATHISYENAYEKTHSLLAQACIVVDQNLNALWDYIFQVEEVAVESGYFDMPSMLADPQSVTDFSRLPPRLPTLIQGSVSTVLGVYSMKSGCIMARETVTPVGRSNSLIIDTVALALSEDGLAVPAEIDAFLTRRYRYEIVPESQFYFSTQNNLSYVPLAHTVQDSHGGMLGNVFLFMNKSSLSTLAGFNNVPYALAMILDQNGEIILDASPDGAPDFSLETLLDAEDGYVIQECGGTDYLLVCVSRSEYGLRYVTSIPVSLLRSDVNRTMSTLLVYMALLLLICIVLCVMLSFHNAQPLTRMLKAVQRVETDPLDYNHLDATVAYLLDDSIALREEMSRQLPDMRLALFSRWLHGEYRAWPAFRDQLVRVGFDLPDGRYAVLVLHYDIAADSSNSNRTIIKGLLRENISHLIGIYDMDFSTMALVTADAGESASAFRLSLEKVTASLQELLHTRLDVNTVFSGSLAEQASDISPAYEEAQRAMDDSELAPHANTSIYWYDSEHRPGGAVIYSIELEIRLIECMRAGDTDGVARALNQIRRESMPDGSLDKSPFKQLIWMLQNTLTRLFQQMGREATVYNTTIQQILADTGPTAGPQDFTAVENIFLAACRTIAEENRQHGQRLLWQIEHYIDLNWTDPQLSLKSLADHIGYTPAYMSRVFKEETGQLFSQYVEKYRMREAVKLIRAKSMSIEAVALATGYASAQVFRRAFRRQYGCSPIEYSLRPDTENISC